MASIIFLMRRTFRVSLWTASQRSTTGAGVGVSSICLKPGTSGQMTPLRARVRNQTWCGSRPHETAERTSLGWEDGDAITVDLEDYH
jgi:hypothetical protein